MVTAVLKNLVVTVRIKLLLLYDLVIIFNDPARILQYAWVLKIQEVLLNMFWYTKDEVPFMTMPLEYTTQTLVAETAKADPFLHI